MEQKGVENPERFLQATQQIPIEVQQVLLQRPEVQQMVQGAIDAKKANSNPVSDKTPQEELNSLMAQVQ